MLHEERQRSYNTNIFDDCCSIITHHAANTKLRSVAVRGLWLRREERSKGSVIITGRVTFYRRRIASIQVVNLGSVVI